MPIANAVFDAVGTVISPKTNIGRTYWKAGVNRGSRRSIAEIEQVFWLVFEQTVKRRATLETSERSEKSFWIEVVSSIFSDVDSQSRAMIFDDLWSHYARPSSWELFPDVLDAWRILQRAGVGIAIASNFDSRLHGICKALFPVETTIQVFDSASIGFRKPAPQFFRHVADEIGCPADRLVMIGDNVDADIRGARNSGWHALLIDRVSNRRTSQLAPMSKTGELPDAVNTLADVPPLLAEIS